MQYDYAEAAALADLIIIVKARFIEAADTFAHIEVRGVRPSHARSLWPACTSDIVDGDYVVPHRPSSQTISRAEEVLYVWLPEYIKDDGTRRLLAQWCSCQATPWISGSFRAFCNKNGLSRSTADRRIEKAFKGVASAILKNAQSLQGPSWSRVMPMMANQRIEVDRMATVTHWMAKDGKPTHRQDMLEPMPRQRKAA